MVRSMKKIVNVFVDGKETSVYDYHIPLLVDLDHEVYTNCFPSFLSEEERVAKAEEWEKELMPSDDSNESMSMFREIIKFLAEMPEAFAYLLGAFAMLSSIVSVVVNYFFYGKLYDRFHRSK